VYSIITNGDKLLQYANEEREEKCHSGREDAPQDVSQVKRSEAKCSQGLYVSIYINKYRNHNHFLLLFLHQKKERGKKRKRGIYSNAPYARLHLQLSHQTHTITTKKYNTISEKEALTITTASSAPFRSSTDHRSSNFNGFEWRTPPHITHRPISCCNLSQPHPKHSRPGHCEKHPRFQWRCKGVVGEGFP